MHTLYSDTRQRIIPRWASGVLALNLGLSLGYVVMWLHTMLQGSAWRADFTSYYTAWRIVLAGQGSQLYDLDVQMRYQVALLGRQGFVDGVLPFPYPPHVAVILAPLGLLPLEPAFFLWSAVLLGFTIWALLLLRQIACDWQPYERWLLFSAVGAFAPLLHAFLLGTFSLWALVCTLQFYLLLKKERDTPAGAWLALSTFKPQIVLLPGVMMFVARRWSALAGACAIGSLLFLFSSLLLGWHIWLAFLDILRASASRFNEYGIAPEVMYNLKGTLTLLLGPDQAPLINQISTAGLGVTILVTIWIWRGRWDPATPAFDLRFALTILLSLLFSPHLNPQDAVVAVIPATLLYHYLRQYRPTQCRGYAVFALSSPLLILIGDFTYEEGLGIRIAVAAMLILTIWISVALRSCAFTPSLCADAAPGASIEQG